MNEFLLWEHDIGFHLGRIEGLAISLSNGGYRDELIRLTGTGICVWNYVSVIIFCIFRRILDSLVFQY